MRQACDRYLTVWGCNKLTDAAIMEVAAKCPQLQSLDVTGCDKLTDAAIKVRATAVDPHQLTFKTQ